MLRRAIGLWVAALLMGGGVPATPAPPLTVREFSGQIGRGVEASFRIKAPLPQVYAVLADPRPGADYLPYVTRVEILADDGREQTVTYHARHLGLFDVAYTLHRRLGPPTSVSFYQEKGLFRRTEGSWTLSEAPDGTRAVYRVQVDPGFFVPATIQSFFLQKGLPAMTDAIRRRCETGGTWRKPR